MNIKNIKGVVKNLGESASKNSPTILTGISVAGLVSTVVLAVKATPKALYLLDERREDLLEMDQEMTKMETIKATWKCYIPAAVMGGVTVGCIIGANSISLRRNAALASVYSLTEATLKEYQEKVVETIGVNKEQKIQDEIAKDRVEKDPVINKEVIVTGKGDMLCYDTISGRYFKSDIEKLRKIQNDANKEIINSMWMSLNDIYYEIGLPSIGIGDELGWNVDALIEFDFRAQIADDGTPCIVLSYNVQPRYDYRKLY